MNEDLKDALEHAIKVVDERSVTQEVLGDLQLADLVEHMTELVAESLRTMPVTEDANANEDALRDMMLTTSMKALLAGMEVGRLQGPPNDPGVVVPIPEEILTEIGLQAIRGGSVSFTLWAGTLADDQ